MEEVFTHAWAETESREIERAREDQLRNRIDQTRADFYPNIEGTVDYTRQDSPGSSGTSDVRGAFSRPDQTTARVTLTQPIFRGFKEFASLRAAHALLNAQTAQTEQARRELFTRVAESYFSVLKAEAMLKTSDELITALHRRIRELQQWVRVGRSTAGDLVAAKAELATAEADRIASSAMVDHQRLQLGSVTGRDRMTPLLVPTGIPDPPLPLDQLLAHLHERPDIRVHQETVRARRHAITVARADRFPIADLTGNYYLDRTGILSDTRWDLNLSVTLPFFQGGRIRATVAEAHATQMAEQFQLSLVERQATQEIRGLYVTAMSLIGQVGKLEEAVKLSRQHYEIQQHDYRMRLVTNFDVLLALNNEIELQRRYENTRYDAWNTLWSLRAAIGQLP